MSGTIRIAMAADDCGAMRAHFLTGVGGAGVHEPAADQAPVLSALACLEARCAETDLTAAEELDSRRGIRGGWWWLGLVLLVSGLALHVRE